MLRRMFQKIITHLFPHRPDDVTRLKEIFIQAFKVSHREH